MIRHVRLAWPDPRPFAGRDARPIRLLAASDEHDPALEHEVNRESVGAVDAVIGAGDLEPHWLAFLADAFRAPLVYVRGNHDRGGSWAERPNIPAPLGAGQLTEIAGIEVAGLEWPGVREPGNERRGGLAWRHVLSVAWRVALGRLLGRARPLLVISHVPPKDAGDCPADAYHVGFPAYRWLLDRLRPPLWLHGHTATASVPELRIEVGATTVVNVTGAVLVELVPPGTAASQADGKGS